MSCSLKIGLPNESVTPPSSSILRLVHAFGLSAPSVLVQGYIMAAAGSSAAAASSAAVAASEAASAPSGAPQDAERSLKIHVISSALSLFNICWGKIKIAPFNFKWFKMRLRPNTYSNCNKGPPLILFRPSKVVNHVANLVCFGLGKFKLQNFSGALKP